jgi:Tol biopolymer transport system component
MPLYVDGVATDIALAPDGSAIAFTAGVEAQLNVRRLDQPEPTPLAGIAGVRGPFFSPDGKWIAYFQVGDLKKVAATGGTPVTICSGCAAGNRGGSWGDDDTIVFAAAGGSEGLRRVRAFGGDPVVITRIDAPRARRRMCGPSWCRAARRSYLRSWPAASTTPRSSHKTSGAGRARLWRVAASLT